MVGSSPSLAAERIGWVDAHMACRLRHMQTETVKMRRDEADVPAMLSEECAM